MQNIKQIGKHEPRIINFGFHPYQNVQNFEANPMKIVPDARNIVKVPKNKLNIGGEAA